jgi:signal transduction histidine kinase/CheY-like chemotaxis protein
MVRFFAQGDDIRIAMGGMTLLFTILVILSVLRMHTTIVSSLKLQFENTSLITSLTAAKESATKLNEELKSEITERKQAEEEIKQSEEKLRSILNSMTDYCYIASKDYEIKFMNKAMIERLGDQTGNICYKAFFDRVSPCPWTKSGDIQKGKTVRWEHYFPKLEGTFEIIDSPLINKDGTISKLGMWRDISERKKAEEALKHKLFVLSQPAGKISNLKLTDIIDVDVLQKLQDGFAELYDVASLIVDNEGKPITRPSNFSGFCKIIRATKRGTERCEISDANLSRLVSNGSSAVAPCRNFEEIQDGAVPIFIGDKIVSTWAIGQKVTNELHEEKVHNYAKEIGADPDQLISAAKKLKPGSKEQFRRAVSFLEVVANNISLLGLQNIQQAREISERKQAEEEKEKLQAQLLQIQKMEAIGILAGGVAHDFNNILTAILGYTDLAMMKVDEADPLYRDLKQIDISATRAASLTRQLLLFSRRQPMEFTSFNLNTTVDNLLKMLHRLIGEDIAIKTELDPELWTVQADAGNIEQVIMNLTVNARDAMPEGGTLTIKTENMHVDEDYCKTYTYAHPGRFVCISVQDTGVGMDKEIIDSIFEPFFTTKGPGKGTGMGLSVVYGIVKQHDGWVNVYSEPGQGSTLKIYLPASSLKAEDETKETISLKGLQGSGERILLVEDEEEVREFATMVLGENGYVVYDAANAEEALDIFDKEAGSFDLIFSDVVLPGKSGIQLVDQLISHKPEIRILLSSGYTDHKSQWPVIRERGFRFLQKPYGLTDLLRAIREAIGQDK